MESGEDVAIVEGPVERLAFPDAPAAVAAAFPEKYVDPTTGEPFELQAAVESGQDAALYVLRPRVGHAWVEGAYLETQTRWTSGAGS